MFLINFKAFITGAKAIKLAQLCERVAKKKHVSIAVAVQSADISSVAKSVSIPVLAQHVDCINFGSHTGWVLPESIKEAGAVGSLVNHSEHRIPLNQIKLTIQRLRELNLFSIVCANTPAEAVKISKFNPDMIAVEPPELIGGKISVSDAHPEVITRTTRAIKNIPVLCGAGVHTGHDVKRAFELGAMGVLVASGVTNAKNPYKVLLELVG